MSAREQPLLLEGPAGTLEALYQSPDAPTGAVLLCHPHPLHGGAMQNKVVATLQRIARDAGQATLRFNFRGVGASTGVHAGANPHGLTGATMPAAKARSTMPRPPWPGCANAIPTCH